MIGRAVADGLQSEGHAVDVVRDGAAAELALLHGPYDLAVLDLGLPRKDGFDVLKSLRHARVDVPVLIITARDAVSDRVAGLDHGADDYMVKPFAPDELLERVRRLIRPTTAGNGGSPEAGLTRRERQVLQLLAQGLEEKRIAEALVLSPKTVATHIQRILRKLDVHSRAAAVAMAYRTGLVDPGSFI